MGQKQSMDLIAAGKFQISKQKAVLWAEEPAAALQSVDVMSPVE